MSADAVMPTPAAAPATGLCRFVAVARDIKLSHTVFALPFALLATFLAASSDAGRLPSVTQFVLIIVCMVLARTAAMAMNRWADARLDADNPRTRGRAVPSGRISRPFMLGVVIACGLGFIASAGGFWLIDQNHWPIVLSPAVLAWLCFYSFTKRFTALCHVVLGSALALSPVAAAIAIHPPALQTPAPWLLAGMVACWVAGFDVIYALQDVAIDREQRLHSLPSRVGVEPALWVSRALHVLAASLLVALAWISPKLNVLFAVGVALVIALLIVEHAIVWRSKTRHINVAFFTLNGVISLLLGGLGIADVLIHR